MYEQASDVARFDKNAFSVLGQRSMCDEICLMY